MSLCVKRGNTPVKQLEKEFEICDISITLPRLPSSVSVLVSCMSIITLGFMGLYSVFNDTLNITISSHFAIKIRSIWLFKVSQQHNTLAFLTVLIFGDEMGGWILIECSILKQMTKRASDNLFKNMVCWAGRENWSDVQSHGNLGKLYIRRDWRTITIVHNDMSEIKLGLYRIILFIFR